MICKKCKEAADYTNLKIGFADSFRKEAMAKKYMHKKCLGKGCLCQHRVKIPAPPMPAEVNVGG